jgi:SAM-dependent methyltransferase
MNTLEVTLFLDVGTAGGFLAFEAERAGARVTAMDALSGAEFDRIHFRESLYHLDRASHIVETNGWFTKIKASFWYSWHRYNSNVEVVYAPLSRVPYWERKFDVVFAGAIIEHLSDPVSTIGNLAALANEAVIISFTPVIDSDAQLMETANDWTNPNHNFTFWTLSKGLYKRIFENIGFSVQFVPARARFAGAEVTRPTIIGRRQAAVAKANPLSPGPAA